MILKKNMKNKIIIKRIILLIKKGLKKSPKSLYDPLFIGNEKKYISIEFKNYQQPKKYIKISRTI
jgi:hypothetical protein